MLRPRSRRTRRRVAWLGGAALVALAVALGVMFVIPTHEHKLPQARNGPATRVTVPASEKEVPVKASDRRQIDALLDRFVPAAIARKDPAASYDMTTTSLHEGLSREKWKTGEIPVYPYEPKGTRFHDWTVFLSFPNEVELDLLMQPKHPDKIGSAVLRIDVKRVKSRGWLVDFVYPVEIHSPEVGGEREAAPATPSAIPGRSQKPSENEIKAAVSPWWFVLLGVAGALVLFGPLAFLGLRWWRHRKAKREWQAYVRGGSARPDERRQPDHGRTPGDAVPVDVVDVPEEDAVASAGRDDGDR